MTNGKLSTLRNLLILTAFLLIGLAVAFYFRPQQVDGQIKLGGDFTLQSAAGPVALSDYRGQAVAFFIGYASCPDVCPTALAILSQALRDMPATEQEQVRGLFMSVDPERDSLEHLARFAAFFHPNITGATADRATIDRVVRQYGAFYRKVELDDSAMGYAVDHSSRIYLIDKQGRLAATLTHNSSPAQLRTALHKLL